MAQSDWVGWSYTNAKEMEDLREYQFTYTVPTFTNGSETKQKPKPMTLKEKFILSITSEPKKSFRKAGITNGDDILTDDGAKVFLSWILHSKFAEEFKKEVVDSMLEDIKKEEK